VIKAIPFRRALSIYYFEENKIQISILSSSSIFGLFDKTTIASLWSFGIISSYVQGEYIYRSGDDCHNVYVVFSGELEFLQERTNAIKEGVFLKTFKFDSKLTKRLLKLYKGDCFGDESGYETHSIASYSVRVSSPRCTVFCVPKKVVWNLFFRNFIQD